MPSAGAVSSAGGLIDDGLIGTPRALADVADLRDAAGRRVIRIRLFDGWDLDVLPDRGLDIGAAWWRGRPVAWRSPILSDPGPGAGWAHRFLGGLVVTCGPDNIGAPRDGHGLHGTHSLTPAVDVRWEQKRVDDELEVRVSGTIQDARLFGRRIRVDREITVSTGSPTIDVRDTITNDGLAPEPVAWLYHVNLGAPVVVPGTTVTAPAERWVVREATRSVPSPAVIPRPIAHSEETVFEYAGIRDDDVVVQAPDGSGITLSWTTATLPRLYQWVLPESGAWALGVEPANAPLWGDDRTPPLLAAGASLETAVRITALEDVAG